MKVLATLAVAVVAIAGNASAKIGDTIQQTDAQYGSPTRYGENFRIYRLSWSENRLICYFDSNLCVGMLYANKSAAISGDDNPAI